MEQISHASSSLNPLLDASSRPIYAVDARRQVVYCNAALAGWLGLEPARIVGRSVEYHSEPMADGNTRGGLMAPLTDLCPPPQALAGTPTHGTVGCVGRAGRLVHRRAEFIPLATAGQAEAGILVLLATADMSPHELAAELADEPSADELHRAIRRFRRSQAAEYALETLLGESASMRKVRAQVAAAAASQANVLVRGGRGTGREHVARAIHYQAKDAAGKLVPIDCDAATEETLRRAFESVRAPGDAKQRHTIFLLNLENLPRPLQAQVAAFQAAGALAARLVVTMASEKQQSALTEATDEATGDVDPQVLGAVSTITIDLPQLNERIEDLPIIAQLFLETANRASAKQVGSVRPDALDQLALYRWPGGLDELRAVITAAHAAATTHEITPADLPAVIHHAAKAAATPRRAAEKIVLDELLESIEREVISRALAQVGGNKSAAAELLGMTRPRLYRRLVQLGFIVEAKAAAEECAIMSRIEWVVCERTSRWAAALRMALVADELPCRLRELRHFAELDAELDARPNVVAAIEVHRGNFADVLGWLPRAHEQFAKVRFVGLLDRSLGSDKTNDSADVGDVLLEAGAAIVVASPRRLEAMLELGRRHAAVPRKISENVPLVERVWASLPWQAR